MNHPEAFNPEAFNEVMDPFGDVPEEVIKKELAEHPELLMGAQSAEIEDV